jgi:hypothetical protein
MVPSGTEACTSFHSPRGLRFKLLDGDVVIFGVGAGAFILQRYYKKEWLKTA